MFFEDQPENETKSPNLNLKMNLKSFLQSFDVSSKVTSLSISTVALNAITQPYDTWQPYGSEIRSLTSNLQCEGLVLGRSA